MTTPTDDLLGALRLDGDRVAVHFERTFATSAEDLWNALTEPDRLSRWLAPVDGRLDAGGTYRIDFGDDEVTTGTVQTCDPPRLLDLTWDFPGESTSRLLATIDTVDDGARLILDHSRLPADQAASYGAGWHAHLTRLAALLVKQPLPRWEERFELCLGQYRTAAEVLSAAS